jgi:glyoxylate carboligase
MGAALDSVQEFEELAATAADAPTSILSLTLT